MSQYFDETKRFLAALDPNADKFTFQLFKDDQSGGAKIFHGSLEEFFEQLCNLNQQGYGVFVTVNETDLQGRKRENIKRIRAIWQEDDDGFADDLPLKPHIVIETSSGKYHRYFLTNHDIHDDFKSVMERMVQSFGSDKNAKDISRVLRLPGFNHQKPDKKSGKVTPFLTRIIEINDHPRFSWPEITDAFPPVLNEGAGKNCSKPSNEGSFPVGKAFEYAKVYSALHFISPDCSYKEWIEIGMAIHHDSGGSWDGMILFEFWSMGGFHKGVANKHVTGEPEAKWRSFGNGGITIGTLYHYATENGWDGYLLKRVGDNSDLEAINIQNELFFNEFNRLHGMALIHGKAVIVRNKPGKLGGIERELITTSDMSTYCRNQSIIGFSAKGVIKFSPIYEYWEKHALRNEYKYGARFNPEKGVVAGDDLSLPKADKGYLELYTGLAIAPVEGDCHLILQHIREVWCKGYENSYIYVISWLARVYQEPGKPGETAIVLRSGQGTGKNVIADIVAESFGPHGGIYTKSGDITGRFTDHLALCVFVLLNEAVWGGDRQSEGTLKALITDKVISYEKKYMPKFTVKNCLHLMMASNNDWVAPVGMDDRRYFYLDVDEKYKNDQEYFKKLFEEIENGGKAAFVHYLMNYDITGFNPRVMPRSQSETRKENKLRTRGSVAEWWDDVLDNGYIISGKDDSPRQIISQGGWNKEIEFIATSALHDHYLEWSKKHSQSHPEKKGAFSKALNELLGGECYSRDSQRRGFKLPQLSVCRRRWQKILAK